MKQVYAILFFLLLCLGAGAQTRTYSDNAANTFIFGLDSYFFGESGALDFDLGGQTHQASVAGGAVSVDGTLLPGEKCSAETVIGVHDFTGDRVPELVVARRWEHLLVVTIWDYSNGAWRPVGQMRAQDGKDVRVFRQVVSIRRGEALYSWTWHGNKFDFKASDGSPEPSLP